MFDWFCDLKGGRKGAIPDYSRLLGYRSHHGNCRQLMLELVVGAFACLYRLAKSHGLLMMLIRGAQIQVITRFVGCVGVPRRD